MALREMFEERADFLYVEVVPRPGFRVGGGDGYDVVVRIDGTYASLGSAEDAAEGIRSWLLGALREDIPGVDRDLVWWHGPSR